MSDRDVLKLARALLRLYPRTWRERYGDEWLAMVEDAGLSWSDAADVVGAAALERLRGFVRWRSRDIDPDAAERLMHEGPGASFLIETPVFIVLAAAMFWTCSAWVPFPTSWFTWYMLVGNWPLRYAEVAGLGATWIERVAISFYYFLESTVLTTVLWIGARQLVRLGAPRPSDHVALLVVFGIALTALVIFLVKGTAGVTPRRWRALKIFALTFIFWIAFIDDDREGFWMAVICAFTCARLPYSMSQAFWARQRAAREALEERMRIEFPIKPGGYF